MAGSWLIGLGEGLKGAAQGMGTYHTLKQQALENALRQRQQEEAEKQQAEEADFRSQSLGMQRQGLQQNAAQAAEAAKQNRQRLQLDFYKQMPGGEYPAEMAEAFDPEVRPFVGQTVDRPDQVSPWSGVEGEQGPVVDSWKKMFRMETPADQKQQIEANKLAQKMAELQSDDRYRAVQGENAALRAGAATTQAGAAWERVRAMQEIAEMQRQADAQERQRQAYLKALSQATDEIMKDTTALMMRRSQDPNFNPSVAIQRRAQEIMQAEFMQPVAAHTPAAGGQPKAVNPAMPNLNIR